MAEGAVFERPMARCFKHCPGGGATDDAAQGPPLGFNAAVTALFSLRTPPPNRSDLFPPDDDDVTSMIREVRGFHQSEAFLANPKTAAALARLTESEALAVTAYTCNTPYPLYKWLNAWLMADRRDADVTRALGPFFVLLYRALEKLEPVTIKATRGVRVEGVPALAETFRDSDTRCAPGKELNFWGFASFSTKDNIAGSPTFFGASGAAGIVYTCGNLTAVDVAPLSHEPVEAEVVPLPPLRLKVQSTFKTADSKLIIAVEQLPNGDGAHAGGDV